MLFQVNTRGPATSNLTRQNRPIGAGANAFRGREIGFYPRMEGPTRASCSQQTARSLARYNVLEMVTGAPALAIPDSGGASSVSCPHWLAASVVRLTRRTGLRSGSTERPSIRFGGRCRRPGGSGDFAPRQWLVHLLQHAAGGGQAETTAGPGRLPHRIPPGPGRSRHAGRGSRVVRTAAGRQ